MKANSTIRELVTADYRTVDVLNRFGIDFCESGQQTLSEACQQLHLDESAIDHALADLHSGNGHLPYWNYAAWDSKFIVEFILHAHHHFLRTGVAELIELGELILGDLRTGAADVSEIHRLVRRLSEDLLKYLDLEEKKLFPYILDLEAAKTAHIAVIAPEFGRLENPVRQMEQWHASAVQFLHDIRKKAQKVKVPSSAPAELVSWLALLEEFDANMHLFIHLEANILFPRALAAEAGLLERVGFTTIWFG